MHLRQPTFTCSACGPCDSFIFQNELETETAFSTIWFMEILKIYLEEKPKIY